MAYCKATRVCFVWNKRKTGPQDGKFRSLCCGMRRTMELGWNAALAEISSASFCIYSEADCWSCFRMLPGSKVLAQCWCQMCSWAWWASGRLQLWLFCSHRSFLMQPNGRLGLCRQASGGVGQDSPANLLVLSSVISTWVRLGFFKRWEDRLNTFKTQSIFHFPSAWNVSLKRKFCIQIPISNTVSWFCCWKLQAHPVGKAGSLVCHPCAVGSTQCYFSASLCQSVKWT